MGLTSVNRVLGFVLNFLNLRKNTVPILSTVPQKPCFSSVDIQQPFLRKTPESQGISSAHIARFIEAVQNDPELEVHSLLILRHGAVIAQVAFGVQDISLPKMTFSACKSITSLAVGMLIDEGSLSPDTHVVELFPDKTTAVTRLKYKDLTVEHLLTMTSGISFNEAECMTQSDWVRACFNSTPISKPGKSFAYNSLNSYLLSAIVKRVSGSSLTEYLQTRLWEPLGITEHFWETCPEGVEKGGWGLYLAAEDIAKIGQLLLNNGLWNGRRLISAEYLQKAGSFKEKTPAEYGDFNYGYHIWVGRERNTLLFNGMLGQNVLIFPDTDILLVNHSGNDEMFQQGRYFELAQHYFGETFPQTLPEDQEAAKRLEETVARCRFGLEKQGTRPWWKRLLPREGSTLPSRCRELDGVALLAVSPNAASVGLLPVILQTVQNNYATGLLSLRFEIAEERFVLTYSERDDTHRFEVGFERPVVTELSFKGEPYRVSVNGRFAKNEYGQDVLLVVLAFLETPCTRTLRVVWGQRDVRLYQTERPGEPFLLGLLSDIKQKLDERPLIGAAIDKLDEDYLLYKIDGIFSPTVVLKQEKQGR